MRSARGRRRTKRAARQAAEQVRDGNWVGETWWEEREIKKGERGKKGSTERTMKPLSHPILHVSQALQQQEHPSAQQHQPQQQQQQSEEHDHEGALRDGRFFAQ